MSSHRQPPVTELHVPPPTGSAPAPSPQGAPESHSSGGGGGFTMGKVILALLFAVVGAMFGGTTGALLGLGLGIGADVLGSGGDGSIMGTLSAGWKKVKSIFSPGSDAPEQTQEPQRTATTAFGSSDLVSPSATPSVVNKQVQRS